MIEKSGSLCSDVLENGHVPGGWIGEKWFYLLGFGWIRDVGIEVCIIYAMIGPIGRIGRMGQASHSSTIQ